MARTDAPERYVRRMLANQFIDWRRGSWARRVLLHGAADESVPAPADHAQSAADRDQIRDWHRPAVTGHRVSGSRPRRR
ncbi:hypothetical protein O7622_05065 [Micromonospora sp. WMMD1076]|uniref:hypothetical protein n=1 Tax=Micromonospora sp. WMMD1076 TaxID=3016103 RepID=UPI00249B164F|nr:hypothetical protein [Micromonospora sp. WMMD1076]WFF07948.1 hypothetical protein O7622_05065 [Micromonospora sp. WMMD1076]